MNKISIIIPVYNTEKYLEKCLSSIINQNIKELEIICINDGSLDNSLAILEKFAKLDKRIRIINQLNQGVSVARNSGLNIAQGEYIMFVDSDDWLEQNCLETIYNLAKQNDVDILEFRHDAYLGGKRCSGNFDNLKKYRSNKNIAENVQLLYVIWDKLYKREFLIKNNIVFPKGLINAEDGIFNLECLYASPNIEISEKLCYHYRAFREGGASAEIKDIKNEIAAFMFSFNSEKYKNTSTFYKTITIEKYLIGILFWYHTVYKKSNFLNKITQTLQLNNFYKFLIKNIDRNILDNCPSFLDLESILRKFSFSKILTINNKYTNYRNTKYKNLIILGIQIPLYRIKKDGFTTAWKFSFFGIPILSSEISNPFFHKEKIKLFNIIPILKLNIKKRQQNRYLELITSEYPEYDCYYTFACNCGELFWFLCHFKEINARYSPQKPLIICDKARMLSICKMFENIIKVPSILFEDYNSLFLDEVTNYKNKKFISILNQDYFNNYADINICKKGEHYYKLFRDKLNIQKPALLPNDNEIGSEKIKSLAKDVLQNNFIIITPDAVTLNPLGQYFWTELCKNLNNLGFKIFLNVESRKDTIPAEGIISAFLTIEETYELAKYAKAVIGLRSGLLEILSTTSQVPTFAIYNSYREWLPNKMSPQEAIKGFTLKSLPNIQPEKIYEYCWNEYSPDELIYEITEQFKNISNKNILKENIYDSCK